MIKKKKTESKHVGKHVAKLESSYIVYRNGKQCSHFSKTAWEFQKMFNMELPSDPAIPLVSIRKRMSTQKFIYECS